MNQNVDRSNFYTAPELFNLKRLAGRFKYELGLKVSKPIIALKKAGPIPNEPV